MLSRIVYRLQEGEPQDGTGGGGDLVAIVDAMSEESGDVLLLSEAFGAGIYEDYRSVLLEVVEFEVGEEVADLFLTAHAEWDEPIALTPSAADKRKLQGVCIQNQGT